MKNKYKKSLIGRKLMASTVASFLGLQCGPAFTLCAQELVSRVSGEAVSNEEVRLGPGDSLGIWVRDAEEINTKSYRIEANGDIRVPMIGRVAAAGKTIADLEKALADRLKSIILEPDVHVSLAERNTIPVTVTGSVKNPGVQPIKGRMTLVQALSAAGGYAPDAGYYVRIVRRTQYGQIPIAGAKADASGEFYTAETAVDEVMDGTNPSANMVLQPGDVVNVPQAPIVYVMGETKRTGGFSVAHKNPQVSVLQAVAMAEGITEYAAPQKALILRPVPGGTRQSIEVDLKAVMAGQAEDIRMRADDILFVPNNRSLPKTIAKQVAQAAAAIAVGVAVFRSGRR